MSAPRPNIYLLNDTSSVHAGSRAVVRALEQAMADATIVARHQVNTFTLDEEAWTRADTVLVNGEGTVHHDQHSGRFLLEALRRAQHEGRRTLLVNSIFQQIPPYFADVLAQLDHLSVRETLSAANARLSGGNPVVMLDACAAHVRASAPVPATCRLAPIVVGYQHDGANLGFKLTDLGFPYYGLDEDFLTIVANLRTAKLYITGQHHGVYAAGLAGIPFIAVPSNSHKIQGLIDWCGLPLPLCRSPAEIFDWIPRIEHMGEVFRAFHQFMIRQPVFTREHLWNALRNS